MPHAAHRIKTPSEPSRSAMGPPGIDCVRSCECVWTAVGRQKGIDANNPRVHRHGETAGLCVRSFEDLPTLSLLRAAACLRLTV